LIRSPVVVGGSTFEHLVVERMGIALQVSEKLRPSHLKLLIHELLGCGHVFDPPKAIVQALVGEVGTIHLARKPLATIEAYLYRKRCPGLQADSHYPMFPLFPGGAVTGW